MSTSARIVVPPEYILAKTNYTTTPTDVDAELDIAKAYCLEQGAQFVVTKKRECN